MDKFSFLNAVDISYLESLYRRYLTNPDVVEPSWKAFFQGFDFANEYQSTESVTNSFNDSSQLDAEVTKVVKEFQVIKLIDGYRTRGHLFTKTNPVRERRNYSPSLNIENFGLSASDLENPFQAGDIIGIGNAKLKDIINRLEQIYCHSIGVEYMYIRDPKEMEWIQEKLNKNSNQPKFSVDEKKNILHKLNQAVVFESFLHTKYVGQKRFSLEGGESLIPSIDAIMEQASNEGVECFVVGMSHRGRLNVLANIFGKSTKDIFSEFDGKDYETLGFDGDVKYHLGWTSDRFTNKGNKVNINLAPNPSHLGAVAPVVEGIARAKQEKYFPNDFSKTLPILVHGDAAIAGQGVTYETIQMSKLEGYKTNGTIHIIVNNQIGFTTNYVDGRSSIYCTDVGKVILSLVLHVNADDVEAVVHASLFALEFRSAFKRDVFIDLLGYRKYGHNEGDEPRFTQPKLYKMIAKHLNPRDIYAQKLIEENVIDENHVKQLEQAYKQELESSLESSRKEDKTVITPFMQEDWKDFKRVKGDAMLQKVDTTYPLDKLTKLAKAITELPKDKTFIRKIDKLIKDRKAMFFEKNKLDWAMGELLAYASLLEEGYNVRISGQDVERGTFSHRHAVVKVEDSEEEVILLKTISPKQGSFNIYNSLLSEYGVLGFDYGYAMSSPKTLAIWEAQFGDFSNGAQIMIDQYISSGEDKWKIQNGIVMFLPHGFEGQGAEHSSARLERYLQLCAKDNMFVVNCTTPANLFHLLRRQMLTNYRKPLIVFTPKSLLRHPKAVSTKQDLASRTFQSLIDDKNADDPKKINTLVFCSGKFYYDLLQERENLKRDDLALVRIEQLFPLPEKEIHNIITKYTNAKDIVWAQEEPRNMGAWSYLLMYYKPAQNFRPATRRFYASPASGSTLRDGVRQKEVIDYVFDKSKNNNN